MRSSDREIKTREKREKKKRTRISLRILERKISRTKGVKKKKEEKR